MSISISKAKATKSGINTVAILNKTADIKSFKLGSKAETYCRSQFKNKKDLVVINQYGHHLYLVLVDEKKDNPRLEKLRQIGSKITDHLNDQKSEEVQISGDDAQNLMALAEGIALANYQFLKYFKDKKEKTNSLKKLTVVGDVTPKQLKAFKAVSEAVYETRDLVNEPLSYLTAPALAKEIQRLGKKGKFKVEVLNKKKIEALKMGGLLAVNKGSIDPPTFSIMEWKPKKAKNKKPLILVGKGVVYDTGGLSLKPTANSMDLMKCDMAGAAMMIGTMYAVAKAELPYHVIGLIPATDNRPGGNAYAPGDVIKMHSGLTVEVLNTDAEGRMLLADALSFAKKYNPELVIDSATLTGAAIRAIGDKASCIMGTADEKIMDQLVDSGYKTHERLVKMPFWDDYAESLKSDIADTKNLGGANAGQITAGKFLEKFTDYPWVHIDIAGPSFIGAREGYRTKWATGVGVRLLFDFISNKV